MPEDIGILVAALVFMAKSVMDILAKRFATPESPESSNKEILAALKRIEEHFAAEEREKQEAIQRELEELRARVAEGG